MFHDSTEIGGNKGEVGHSSWGAGEKGSHEAQRGGMLHQKGKNQIGGQKNRNQHDDRQGHGFQ